MHYYCYIIFSPKLNKYYIGETVDISQRLNQHNSSFFKNAFTSQADDWEIFLLINCRSRTHARKIEQHIKKIKSKKHIQNLKLYPEIIKNLIARYSSAQSR